MPHWTRAFDYQSSFEPVERLYLPCVTESIALCAQCSESNIYSCRPRATTKKMHKQVLKDVWWHVPRVKITSPALTAHIKHTAHIEIKRTWTSVCQQHVCRAPISSSWPPAMYASVWLDRRREREDTVKGCNKGGDTHVHISRTRRELEGRLYMDIIWQVKDTISATKTSSIPFPRTSSLPTILCRVSYGGAMIHRSGSVYQFNDW